MKVLIISPCDLPVPAVQGGAVASLMESILKENEKNKRLQITIVTSWTSEAEKKSMLYPNVKFIWIKPVKLVSLVDSAVDIVTSKFRNKSSLPKEYARKIYVISRLKKILSEGDYDDVVVQNSGYLLKAFKDKSIAEKYKGRIYYHLHNDIPMNADDDVLKQVKFILISRFLLKKLIVKCGKDVEKRCYIVKNGIDCEKFTRVLDKKEKSALKKKLEIDEDKKVIVFVGRIVWAKGIKELLDAIMLLNNKSVMLLIVGSTNFGAKDESEFECEIRQRCEELKDQVRFTGFIHNDEVWKYYKLGDVAVLPSIWEEPAGLTMIEAALSGLPVVTTYSGGIPEYLNSEYAFFISKESNTAENIKNAVDEILSDEARWKETGKKASEYVMNNFSEYTFYSNFADIFDSSV